MSSEIDEIKEMLKQVNSRLDALEEMAFRTSKPREARTKKCAYCQKEFTPLRRGTKYCSVKCSLLAREKEMSEVERIREQGEEDHYENIRKKEDFMREHSEIPRETTSGIIESWEEYSERRYMELLRKLNKPTKTEEEWKKIKKKIIQQVKEEWEKFKGKTYPELKEMFSNG